MKRYSFSQYDGIVNLELPFEECEPVERPSDKKDADGVFELIFANDPLTSRPRSDLGTYLTDNTNPLLRDFIERNLRNDMSGHDLKVPDGISDDDIHYLTRDRSETDVEYIGRVNRYMNVQKQRYQDGLRFENAKRISESKTE